MMDSAAAPDFYAVLQVNPSADQEIIEAAYRQLMKKYHPDLAGTDAQLAAEHHQRAKLINQAHSVLRDPARRRQYDESRGYRARATTAAPARQAETGTQTSTSGEPAQWSAANGTTSTAWDSLDGAPAWMAAEKLGTRGEVHGPLSALVAAYYLLPGPYEWEGGRGRDLVATCLLPPVGIAAYALATGRLAPLVGHSLGAIIAAWAVLLVCTLPSWTAMPRLAMASLPSVVLLSGVGNAVLAQSGVPIVLAWVVAGFMSLLLSARLYVFAVLPTLGACWLVNRIG